MSEPTRSVYPAPIVVGWRHVGLALVVLASIWSGVSQASADWRASPPEAKGVDEASKILLESAQLLRETTPLEAFSQWMHDRRSDPAEILRSLDGLEKDHQELNEFQRNSW